MKTTGFYKLKEEYIDLIKTLNGKYHDHKERPIFCCIQDRDNPNIYWAIPTSDLAHRSDEQLSRIQALCALPDRDIRSCYYHIGHTNRPAIFKVSNVLPITDQYIAGEYMSQNVHLMLKDTSLISILTKKVSRILQTEKRHNNKFEQHITTIYNYLLEELLQNSPNEN